MGGCSSSIGTKANPKEIDVSWFELQTTIGKGGFGHVHCVTMADEKQTMYAQKRQVIHDVCAKGMEMEVRIGEQWERGAVVEAPRL